MFTPIDLDYDDYELKTPAIITDSNQVRVADLEEEESSRIQRTSSAAAEMIQLVPQVLYNDQLDETRLSDIPTIADRVAEAAQNTALIAQSTEDIEPLLELIEARRTTLEDESIPLPELAELDELLGPDATIADKRSFLIQINTLVADIMRLISKLNDRDRQKNDHMKKEYGVLNNVIGNAIGGRGLTNFWSNVGALLVHVGGAVIGSAIGKPAFVDTTRAISQQIPAFAGILSTGHEVTQTMSSNRLNMISTDMQSTSQKSGDNSGWKNELTQALSDVRQWMTTAARSN